MAYLLLGLALLGGFLLIVRGFVEADPRTLKSVFKWVAVAGLLSITVLLAVTGRLAWAAGAAMMLFPLASRLYRAHRTAKNFARAAGVGGGGQTTGVETRYLKMSLDHDTGDIDGEVLEGAFAGRRLGDLDVEDLARLHADCGSSDPQSAQILETYLDRVHPGWRERREAGGGGHEPGSDGATMTVDEAYDVLGLQKGAGEAEIKAAHQRLIAALHPDTGGSNYLAAKINRARQVLLGR